MASAGRARRVAGYPLDAAPCSSQGRSLCLAHFGKKSGRRKGKAPQIAKAAGVRAMSPQRLLCKGRRPRFAAGWPSSCRPCGVRATCIGSLVVNITWGPTASRSPLCRNRTDAIAAVCLRTNPSRLLADFELRACGLTHCIVVAVALTIPPHLPLSLRLLPEICSNPDHSAAGWGARADISHSCQCALM